MPSRRVPFIAKPESGARLNGSRIARDLTALLLYNEGGGYPRDLVSGAAWDGNSLGEAPAMPTRGMSRGGLTANGTGKGGYLALPKYREATKITAVLILDDALNHGSLLAPSIGSVDAQAVDYSNWRIALDDGANTFNGFTIYTGPSNVNGATTHSGAGTGLRVTVGAGLHIYAFVGYNVASDCKWDVYADGVFRQTVTVTSAALGSSNTNIFPFWRTVSSPKVVAAGFYSRNLTSVEIANYLRSPLAFYNAVIATPARRRTATFAIVAAAPQLAYAASDITTASWTSSLGGSLYAAIDEPTTADDADYIFSPDNPTTEEFEIKFGPLADPGVDTGHIVRYRVRAIGLDTAFRVTLMCGATQIAQWTDTATVVAGATTYTKTLTALEAAAITDYTDLRLRGRASA